MKIGTEASRNALRGEQKETAGLQIRAMCVKIREKYFDYRRDITIKYKFT